MRDYLTESANIKFKSIRSTFKQDRNSYDVYVDGELEAHINHESDPWGGQWWVTYNNGNETFAKLSDAKRAVKKRFQYY